MASEASLVLRLVTTAAEKTVLTATLQAYAELSAWLDESIPREHSRNLVMLHRGWYEAARQRSALPAQCVTLALRDWAARQDGSAPAGGLPLDRKLYALKDMQSVSLATLQGRLELACVMEGYVGHAAGPAPARLSGDGSDWRLTIRVDPTLLDEPGRRFMTATENLTTRVGRVVMALTHSGLDRAEKARPEAVLDQAFREIVAAEDHVRRDLGRAIADARRVSLRDAELEREHDEREGDAHLALSRGRDDLARAAVERQLDIETQRAALDRLAAEKAEAVDALEQSLAAVEASRREAEARLAEYKRSSQAPKEAAPAKRSARHNVEGAKSAIARVTGVSDFPLSRHGKALDEIAKLRRESQVDDRLARLKASGAKG